MSSDAGQLDQRARLHAALGDPHRLAVVDALALSDRSPSELAEALGIRSNLLAHHLAVLQREGVIETLHSEGDARRRYVKLRRGMMARLATPAPAVQPGAVLFVCSSNSARSPLAAALWRQYSDVPVLSAGTRPASRVHPFAVAAGESRNLDLDDAEPRSIQATGIHPDLIVAVCDEAYEALTGTETAPQLHWSIPDPVRRGTRDAFEWAIDQLCERIEDLSRAVGPQAA